MEEKTGIRFKNTPAREAPTCSTAVFQDKNATMEAKKPTNKSIKIVGAVHVMVV